MAMRSFVQTNTNVSHNLSGNSLHCVSPRKARQKEIEKPKRDVNVYVKSMLGMSMTHLMMKRKRKQLRERRKAMEGSM